MEKLSILERLRIPDYFDAGHMKTGILEFSDEKCKRCGLCVKICPARSILMDKGKKGGEKPLPYLFEVEPGVTMCVSCGCCAAACPEDAITVVRGFCAGYHYKKLHQAPELAPPKQY
ncbi:MAG: ATP-binding protein [Desulfatibacillaceae bacterium]